MVATRTFCEGRAKLLLTCSCGVLPTFQSFAANSHLQSPARWNLEMIVEAAVARSIDQSINTHDKKLYNQALGMRKNKKCNRGGSLTWLFIPKEKVLFLLPCNIFNNVNFNIAYFSYYYLSICYNVHEREHGLYSKTENVRSPCQAAFDKPCCADNSMPVPWRNV